MKNGRVKSFYLGARHENALAEFARRHDLPSASAALRSVLDQVADVYLGPTVPVSGDSRTGG